MNAAEVTSYTELVGAIQVRIGELGIRQLDFDKLAGFPEGLSGKAFGMLQVKRLGPEKLFDALRAAGLKLRIEADPEQLEKMQKQIAAKCQTRQANQSRPGHSASLPSAAVFTRILRPVGKLGGRARWRKKSKKERSEHMRMMAMAGIRKRRKLKKRARQQRAAHKARKEAAANA